MNHELREAVAALRGLMDQIDKGNFVSDWSSQSEECLSALRAADAVLVKWPKKQPKKRWHTEG